MFLSHGCWQRQEPEREYIPPQHVTDEFFQWLNQRYRGDELLVPSVLPLITAFLYSYKDIGRMYIM